MKNIPKIDNKIIIGYSNLSNLLSIIKFLEELRTNKDDKRIKILKNSDDGFYIAEEDLKLRGFGDLIGYQQSGLKNFKFADPVNHEELFKLAEKYILNIGNNINQNKYIFLLKSLRF